MTVDVSHTIIFSHHRDKATFPSYESMSGIQRNSVHLIPLKKINNCVLDIH